MKRARRFVFAVLTAVLVVLLTLPASARPGGGSHFSGSSHSSSGGFSGSSHSSGGTSFGGAEGLIGFAVVFAIGLIIAVVQASTRRSYGEWSSGSAATEWTPPPVPRTSARKALEQLRAEDENFSYILFEDFLNALYVEAHTARGQGQIARLSAYFAPPVLTQLGGAAGPVSSVIVGAMRVVSTYGAAGLAETTVDVQFEANYTEGQQGFYVKETWRLMRKRGVKSRTPEKARVFGCPSCGAPQDQVIAGTCRYCNQVVATGSFDWLVVQATLDERETRGPILTTEQPEEGTNAPTLVDPEAQPRFAAMQVKDPSFNWPAFQQRVALVFNEFQLAWAARDLARMRPYMSDNLFATQTYWVTTYRTQRLRNITENARIAAIQIARITSDKFFDGITVRLFASSLDYTVADDTNKVVCGSRSRERRYSEYWTLIRGTNRKGPTRTAPICPSCGAALKINMVGTCEYCNAKVTSGDFDWVLSRIEQDEVYEG